MPRGQWRTAYWWIVSATPVTQPTAVVRIPRELWVLMASAFVIALGFGLILPVLPQFAQSFGVGATASSIVVSAFAFFRLLFAPAGGRLIARFGERPIYLAGLVIVAISTGATAFAHSYWQLLLYRGLGGIGSVMFTVSAVALIVRLAPPTIRARVSSVYASAFLFGGILGPVFGGLLATSVCACRSSCTPWRCSSRPRWSRSSSAAQRCSPPRVHPCCPS